MWKSFLLHFLTFDTVVLNGGFESCGILSTGARGEGIYLFHNYFYIMGLSFFDISVRLIFCRFCCLRNEMICYGLLWLSVALVSASFINVVFFRPADCTEYCVGYLEYDLKLSMVSEEVNSLFLHFRFALSAKNCYCESHLGMSKLYGLGENPW